MYILIRIIFLIDSVAKHTINQHCTTYSMSILIWLGIVLVSLALHCMPFTTRYLSRQRRPKEIPTHITTQKNTPTTSIPLFIGTQMEFFTKKNSTYQPTLLFDTQLLLTLVKMRERERREKREKETYNLAMCGV